MFKCDSFSALKVEHIILIIVPISLTPVWTCIHFILQTGLNFSWRPGYVKNGRTAALQESYNFVSQEMRSNWTTREVSDGCGAAPLSNGYHRKIAYESRNSMLRNWYTNFSTLSCDYHTCITSCWPYYVKLHLWSAGDACMIISINKTYVEPHPPKPWNFNHPYPKNFWKYWSKHEVCIFLWSRYAQKNSCSIGRIQIKFDPFSS